MMALLESNPGLKSRFSKFVHFEDYTAMEMAQIFEYMLEKGQYRADEKAQTMIEPMMCSLHETRDKHIGNARVVRNLFEHVQQEQANRLSSVSEPTREELRTIEASDIQGALPAILPRPERDEQTGTHDAWKTHLRARICIALLARPWRQSWVSLSVWQSC